MDANELRALADALYFQGRYGHETERQAATRRVEERKRAATYLRAQADAQPVATLTLLDDMGAQIDFRQSFTLLPGQTFSLYAHPAPQAEPTRDWSAIDTAIREYLDGYEQIGENDAGADACYTPTERELYLIYDAINGLFADDRFMRLVANKCAHGIGGSDAE